MTEFVAISVEEAHRLWQNDEAVLADIRDPQNFSSGHVPGSFHLADGSLSLFMQETALDVPVMVICYHGNSSRGAAQYLIQQGYERVYSINGGFEAWNQSFPEDVQTDAQLAGE